MSYVAHMPGFTTLPRILIPKASSARMPPIMHYGWLVNADMLFNYAEKHGLLDYSEQYVNEDDEDDLETIDVVDRDGTTYRGLYHIVRSIGGSSPPLHVELMCVYNRPNPMMVSLFTNYTLTSAPTDEFTKKLCEKLQLTGEPRWYLDSLDCCWRTRVPDRMLLKGSGLHFMK